MITPICLISLEVCVTLIAVRNTNMAKFNNFKLLGETGFKRNKFKGIYSQI